MNNIKRTERVYIRDLNANDLFVFPGTSDIKVCMSRRSDGGQTLIAYRPYGSNVVSEYARPGLSTVDLVLD